MAGQHDPYRGWSWRELVFWSQPESGGSSGSVWGWLTGQPSGVPQSGPLVGPKSTGTFFHVHPDTEVYLQYLLARGCAKGGLDHVYICQYFSSEESRCAAMMCKGPFPGGFDRTRGGVIDVVNYTSYPQRYALFTHDESKGRFDFVTNAISSTPRSLHKMLLGGASQVWGHAALGPRGWPSPEDHEGIWKTPGWNKYVVISGAPPV